MTPRDVLAALRHPFGSALREPSQIEVYEGRLPSQVPAQAPVSGANLLDRGLGQVKGRPAPVKYAPWCVECRLEPVGGPWTLQGAEYLARQHDALWHGAAWTAQALPADEVVRLAAGGGSR